MRGWGRLRTVGLALTLCGGSGCLVLAVHPAYDHEAIAWDPDLLGAWESDEDNASLDIQRGEWRSYRVHYRHPIETGDLTAYLTVIGDERYLDLMPARGQDRGSFLVPVHAVVRVRRQGEALELTPFSYDWFSDRLRAGRPLPGLSAILDQKENALITAPTARLRTWMRSQPAGGPMFGAPATFRRK